MSELFKLAPRSIVVDVQSKHLLVLLDRGLPIVLSAIDSSQPECSGNESVVSQDGLSVEALSDEQLSASQILVAGSAQELEQRGVLDTGSAFNRCERVLERIVGGVGRA